MNRYRGQVALSIEEEDGSIKEYTLHFDGNALVDIEDAMGYPINTLIKDKPELMDGFKFRRAALHAGLQRDPRGRKITLKQCGELVASSQATAIAKAVLRGMFLALGADLSKLEETAEAEEQAAAANDKKPGKKGKAAENPLAPAQP